METLRTSPPPAFVDADALAAPTLMLISGYVPHDPHARSTMTKVEWFSERKYAEPLLFEPTVFAASPNEIYVADSDA